MKTIRLLASVFFLGLAASRAADAPKVPPSNIRLATPEELAAASHTLTIPKEYKDAGEWVEALQKQITQLTAAVRKLQEQRDALAKQLLDAEVQTAANASVAAPAK